LVYSSFQRAAACHFVAGIVGAVNSPVAGGREFTGSEDLRFSAAAAVEKVVLAVSHGFLSFAEIPYVRNYPTYTPAGLCCQPLIMKKTHIKQWFKVFSLRS
jgi:hypothetical protein